MGGMYVLIQIVIPETTRQLFDLSIRKIKLQRLVSQVTAILLFVVGCKRHTPVDLLFEATCQQNSHQHNAICT